MDRQVFNDPMIDHLTNEKPIFKPRIFVLLAHGYLKIVAIGNSSHPNNFPTKLARPACPSKEDGV